MSLGISQAMMDVASDSLGFSGPKTDVLLTIDSRTILPKMGISVSIGLLEPRNYSALNTTIITDDPQSAFSTKQVLLSTATIPWVVAIVYLWDNAAHPQNKNAAWNTPI